MRPGSAAVVIVLLLAGCAGSPPAPTDPGGAPDDVGPGADVEGGAGRPSPAVPGTQGTSLPSGYSYACPPGDTVERSPGVCAASVEDLFNSLDEPYVAIHPTKDDVMALGAHSTSTNEFVWTDPAAVDTLRIAVYVTEDGGATWRRTLPPRVEVSSAFGPVELRIYYDPALAFDDTGVLHLVGIASNDLGSSGGRRWDASNVPFHVSSPDLGKTWGTPTVLDERYSDRTFLAVGGGGIYVDWGRYVGNDLAAQAAWSLDGGATWRKADTPGCRGFSPFLAVPGGAEVVCVAGTGAQPDQASLLRLDAANGTFAQVGAIPGVGGYRPRLGLLPGGGRVVAAEAATIHAAASRDGGATWGPAVDLLDGTGISEPGSWLKWAAPDPWGGLHLEVGETQADGCIEGNRGAPGTCAVHHFAFDPLTWKPLARKLLSPADTVEAYRVPGTLVPPQEAALGDDFYSFAFGRDRGVLLWTRDGGTDYTFVHPVA